MSDVEYCFPQLGKFLESLMLRLKITKVRVLGDEHVGTNTYASLKGGRFKSELLYSFCRPPAASEGRGGVPPCSAGGSGCLYQSLEAERGGRGKGVRAEEAGRKAGGAEGEDEAA